MRFSSGVSTRENAALASWPTMILPIRLAINATVLESLTRTIFLSSIMRRKFSVVSDCPIILKPSRQRMRGSRYDRIREREGSEVNKETDHETCSKLSQRD